MHLRNIVMLRALIASTILFCGGCLSTIIPDHAPATTDDATVQLMLQRHDFEGAGFVRVNRAPFASDLETGRVVTMYVSQGAEGAYEAVTPESEAAGPPFPVGGMIVRTSSDMSGNLLELTFMVKHEAGYFPEVGDFAFGVTDPDGTPQADADGNAIWGKVQDCALCHESRASAGFLFGVSAAHR